MYKFNGLEIDKTEETHVATLRYERAILTFSLEAEEGSSRASFPISRGKNSDKKISSEHGKNKTKRARQFLFEQLICCLASLHPKRHVPNAFQDAQGNIWKLDKTAAKWALESSRFTKETDEYGYDALKPQLI